MTQLTTLAKVKLSLGITGTDQDVLLTDFINQVSAFIQSFIGKELEASERTEIFDRPCGDNLFLPYYPIITTEQLVVEYRNGSVGNPTWTPYTVDDYYVYAKEGYLKMIAYNGDFVGGEYQTIRATWTGGYLIDFASEGNLALHNLPADITGVATQLTVSMFNQRSSDGIKSESTEGQSITYEAPSESTLNTSQSTTLNAYKRYNV